MKQLEISPRLALISKGLSILAGIGSYGGVNSIE